VLFQAHVTRVGSLPRAWLLYEHMFVSPLLQPGASSNSYLGGYASLKVPLTVTSMQVLISVSSTQAHSVVLPRSSVSLQTDTSGNESAIRHDPVDAMTFRRRRSARPTRVSDSEARN